MGIGSVTPVHCFWRRTAPSWKDPKVWDCLTSFCTLVVLFCSQQRDVGCFSSATELPPRERRSHGPASNGLLDSCLSISFAPGGSSYVEAVPQSLGMTNVFSVDLEDYFHPTEVSTDATNWPRFAARIEIGTNFLLDLLAEHQTLATFFILGWVADSHPKLVRRITEAGHEIGCHSYYHKLVYSLTPTEFREDTRQAMHAIEDVCGLSPRLYRAPSYSIVSKSFWALDILAELGFTHDSSIYPMVHDRYGIPGFSRHAHTIQTLSGPILEVPIATARLSAKHVTPVGGGAYLRLFPYRYAAAGIRQINRVEQQPACIYTHPWELDPDQPRVTKGFISRIRTYGGLGTMRGKLKQMFQDFRFSTIGDVCRFPAASFVSQASAG
jgi:polysaccharide deacetylase family protein (PEP-CTERM system associated)